jgi:hypothetical protein
MWAWATGFPPLREPFSAADIKGRVALTGRLQIYVVFVVKRISGLAYKG